MKKPCFTKVPESFNKITDNWNGLLLWKFDSFFEESFQISLIAEFSDNVTIVCCTINVMTFENVRMV